MSAEFIEVGQTLDRNLFLNPKESHYPFFYLLGNGNKFFHIDHMSRTISENLDSWILSGVENDLRSSLTYYPSGTKQTNKNKTNKK